MGCQLRDDPPHLGFRVIEPAARVDHEIRSRSLLGIRHLLGADRLERRLGHAGTGEHAGALNLRRRGDDEDGVAAGLGPGLEQERDVEDDERRVRVAGEEGAALVADQRMHDRLQPRELFGISEHRRTQGRPVKSQGTSYAQTWADVPFQRMPNVNLLPNAERDVTLDELLDGVQNGILIEGRGSYSIDQQRYNAQFGGQAFWEIKDGRKGAMLKDVAYQIRTPEFWNSLDGLGGPSSYGIGGTFTDGKGQPGQSNAVSHRCPPARFRGVTVLNTGRGA